MNFSFDSKFISFAKAGDAGYLKLGEKKVSAHVGSRYVIRVFGREFTNKDNP